MRKSVASLQSNYLPWKGYFDIVAAADEFIFYDDVQYTKNDLIAHFNYGVIGAYLTSSGKQVQLAEGVPSWQESLQFFLNNYQKVNNVPGQTAEVARNMLSSAIKGRPPVMELGEPAEDKIEFYRELLLDLRSEP